MIRNSIIKIVCILIIIGLNWAGLSAVGETLAYFFDSETSNVNSFQAASLDFYLNAPGDFSLNFTADNFAVRNVSIINIGILPFQYIIEGASFAGSLCETINLEAKLDGATKYNDSLMGFILDPSVEISGSQDNWLFIFSFSGDVETYKNTPCQFYLNFDGWQDNLANYPNGFSDRERVLTHLTLRAEKTVVLNEFLPNPEGNEGCLQGVEGEWVEIYNNSDQPEDLANWYIHNGQNTTSTTVIITSSNTFSGSTVIGPRGSGSEWLVVLLNDCILDNDGDSVNLYNSNNNLIDSYCYSGPAPENKSYARYPDGTGPWYDPVPTPGGPNILTLEEISQGPDIFRRDLIIEEEPVEENFTEESPEENTSEDQLTQEELTFNELGSTEELISEESSEGDTIEEEIEEGLIEIGPNVEEELIGEEPINIEPNIEEDLIGEEPINIEPNIEEELIGEEPINIELTTEDTLISEEESEVESTEDFSNEQINDESIDEEDLFTDEESINEEEEEILIIGEEIIIEATDENEDTESGEIIGEIPESLESEDFVTNEIIEEETLVVEEQPATLPDDDSFNQEEVSGGDSGGNSDTDGDLNSDNSTEDNNL